MGKFNSMESKQVLVHLWWEVAPFKNNEIFWQFQEDHFLEFDFFSHQYELVLFKKLLNFGKHQIDIILRGYWSIVLDLPPIFNALIQKLVFFLFLCKDVCSCIWQQLLLWQYPFVPLTISFLGRMFYEFWTKFILNPSLARMVAAKIFITVWRALSNF